MKTCSKCKLIKPLNDFSKNKSSNDGFQHYCKECKKIIDISYRNKNKDKIKINHKLHREQNKDKVEIRRLIFIEKNPDYYSTYRSNNKESKRKRQKENYHRNPINKLKHLFRTRLKKYIDRKSIPSESIIGCSWETLKEHIEKQFQANMNWENHAQFGWHIDHIIPLATAKTEEDLYKLNHYTNLQPLWWMDNLIKRDKIIEY
jgi:hypothetical protein